MSDHISMLLQQARRNFKVKNFHQTKILISNIPRIESKNFDAPHIMGVLLAIEHNHSEAIDFFTQSNKN